MQNKVGRQPNIRLWVLKYSDQFFNNIILCSCMYNAILLLYRDEILQLNSNCFASFSTFPLPPLLVLLLSELDQENFNRINNYTRIISFVKPLALILTTLVCLK
jgi:hypothetical protein